MFRILYFDIGMLSSIPIDELGIFLKLAQVLMGAEFVGVHAAVGVNCAAHFAGPSAGFGRGVLLSLRSEWVASVVGC
jgi:hypothetical protein